MAPRARVKSARDCIASSHVLPMPAQYQDTTRRRRLYTQNVAKYIRVSTSLQDFQRQEDGLNQYIERNSNWKLYGSFDDMASGKNDQRVGFQNMMKAARGRRFQILILWDLDRLGRSLVDLISNCNELMSLGIDIHFINANMVLNNSPETQFTFHILGAAAQFERNLISRRTKEGIAAAKKRGVRFGSPLKITPAHHPKLIKMWEDGVTIPKMAKAFNVSTTTIRRYRRSLGLPARGKDHLRDITKRPEWASVALKNKSKYTHINGIENAMTWSQKRADEYWAKRA